jgi:hypothetical protein
MAAWVALVYMCSPLGASCNLIGSPSLFLQLENCRKEMIAVAQYYEAQQFLVHGFCHEVKLDQTA